MPPRIAVECPAKINLFLAVGPRDARGYHPLRTIFQEIDLCDTLTVETGADEPGFFCNDPSVPTDNTVTRAHSLLREVAALPPMRIELKKRIPSESGLGGGSSDAAGFLRAAARLLPKAFPPSALHAVAAAVGADVPFFLVGGRARAEGYGERLTRLPDGPSQWLVVARPNLGCPTAEMYRRLDELSYAWRNYPSGDGLYNDFVRVAPPECLGLIGRLIEAGATDATLAGSGSAVFGLFPGEADARRAAGRLGASAVWVCRTRARKRAPSRVAG